MIRPNGKIYRPRKKSLVIFSWGEDYPHGCIVFGTLDPDEAKAMADQSLARWCGGVAIKPDPDWYRQGYDQGGWAWIRDEVRGRPGVLFTCDCDSC